MDAIRGKTLHKIYNSLITTFHIAMLAAQSRMIATLEHLYGDQAINNRTFQEYKRVAEAFERDTKDNLVKKIHNK
jgi:hypothetical protein